MPRCRTTHQKRKARRRLKSIKKQQSKGIEKTKSPNKYDDEDE